MMSTDSILQAVENIQPEAQSRLPVLPNNGNPQGANNMPATQPQTQPVVTAPAMTPAKSPYFYPWLKPSPHMDTLRDMINAPIYSSNKPTYTSQQVPEVPPPQQPESPIMPYRNPAGYGQY